MFRRVSGEALPGIAEEGVLPNVDPRAPTAAGEKGTEGSGMGEGDRAGRRWQGGTAALRLCNLVAQGPSDTEGGVQEGSGERTDGRETEPWEIIYFKLYQSQVPVIEKAIETAALKLGSDRSRGYCLEMICADFLAGANLDNGDPEMLLFSMTRFFKFLPQSSRRLSWRPEREGVMSSIGQPALTAGSGAYKKLRNRSCVSRLAVSSVRHDIQPGSPSK